MGRLRVEKDTAPTERKDDPQPRPLLTPHLPHHPSTSSSDGSASSHGDHPAGVRARGSLAAPAMPSWFAPASVTIKEISIRTLVRMQMARVKQRIRPFFGKLCLIICGHPVMPDLLLYKFLKPWARWGKSLSVSLECGTLSAQNVV